VCFSYHPERSLLRYLLPVLAMRRRPASSNEFSDAQTGVER
jgi:hypothetical protein